MATLKEQLINSHPLWKKYINRWQFLIDSYMGGADYKSGKYLSAYLMENEVDYEERLKSTPLDNHVKSLVEIYNSFLFRKSPHRDFEELSGDPVLDQFMKDADLDGRSFDSIMRDVATYSSVYGHVWVVMDKPATTAYTRAEELGQGIRPYISLYTPENVLDWRWTRQQNGFYRLTYLKLYEGADNGEETFRIYTPEEVMVVTISEGKEPLVKMQMPNQLGKVPAVCVYSKRSPIKGVGLSDVADVADMQMAIYNELSECEQLLRLTNHPSLVKTASTSAAAGAGAIIQIPEDTTDATKPYLLQPSGASLDGILSSLRHKIESIDRMTHMGGIRSIESRRLSGVALATEFQLLNARLAAKASELEFAEEQLWRLFGLWQGVAWSGYVEYPKSFNIQDKYNDMNMLKLAKDANPRSDVVNEQIERQMLKVLVDDDDLYAELVTKINFVSEVDIQGKSYYPDGEEIPSELPSAYQDYHNEDVPPGQKCKNCSAYNPENNQCSVWAAEVRPNYWCKKWIPINTSN